MNQKIDQACSSDRMNTFEHTSLGNTYAMVEDKRFYDKPKRILDFLVSLLAAVVLFPFLLIIALIIYIDDPKGSPIYVSKRTGKCGKTFRFYKFRTMYVGADSQLEQMRAMSEVDGPVFKMKDDPRITRVGRFLRRTSIDELPQLLNVIKGDMSVVGPRPPIPQEVSSYTPYEMRRLSIRPGLTCIWQVQKNRNSVSFADWVAMDLHYIRERNPLLDFKLIFMTIMVMFKGEGI